MENSTLPIFCKELIPLFPYFLIPFQQEALSLLLVQANRESGAVAAGVVAPDRVCRVEAAVVRVVLAVLLPGPNVEL